MKKLISLLIAVLVMVSFSVTAGATSQEFSVAIPDYMEKVNDTQWFTDDYIISVTGERAQVTMTIGFYPITQKEKDFLVDSAFKTDLQAELEKDPLFKEFVVPPLTTTTLNGYKTVYTSYIKESNGMKYSACNYYFFSDNQKCVVSFNSTSPFFAASEEEADKIVNTLSFTGNFKKEIQYTPPTSYPSLEEIEEIHSALDNIEKYEDESRAQAAKEAEREKLSFNEINALSMRNGLSTGMLVFLVAYVVNKLIKSSKENKGKKLTNADKVALMTRKKQDELYKVGNIALIAEVVVGVPSLAYLAFVLMDLMDATKSLSEMDEAFRKLVFVASAILLVCASGIAFIKARYPYYSDGKFMYIRKMRKGKVPQVCADSQAYIPAQASVQKKVPQLGEVIGQYAVKCNYTIEQQREWLTVLHEAVSTITLGGNPIDADRFLQPNEVEKAGSMLNTVARTAFMVGKVLGITNLEKALNTGSEITLIRAYCILDEYAKTLKETYRVDIDKAKAYIYSILEKADMTKFASEEIADVPAAQFVNAQVAGQQQMPQQAEAGSKAKSKKTIKYIIGGAFCMVVFAFLTISELSDMKVFDLYEDEPFTILRYAVGIVSSFVLGIYFLFKKEE